jgi:hypothetical protein
MPAKQQGARLSIDRVSHSDPRTDTLMRGLIQRGLAEAMWTSQRIDDHGRPKDCKDRKWWRSVYGVASRGMSCHCRTTKQVDNRPADAWYRLREGMMLFGTACKRPHRHEPFMTMDDPAADGKTNRPSPSKPFSPPPHLGPSERCFWSFL